SQPSLSKLACLLCRSLCRGVPRDNTLHLIEHRIRKRADCGRTSDSLLEETFYVKKTSLAVRLVRCHDSVGARRYRFSCSADRANARGNHYDVCAGCGKG